MPPSSLIPLGSAYNTIASRNILDIFQRPGIDPNAKEKAGKEAAIYEGLKPAAPDFDYQYFKSDEYQTKVIKKQLLEGSMPGVRVERRGMR